LSILILHWGIARLAWWHISRTSRLTELLGWCKTRLAELRLLHIWVWIHSTWLSVLWYRHHASISILSLWHIWVLIHSTWLSVCWYRHHYWLWGRHIVWVTLSKVLRIVVMRIILRIRIVVFNTLCICYSFLMIILITNILRLTILSSLNDLTDAATNETQNN